VKIVFIISGNRGIIQPMVGLATGLMKKGHEVIIFAPPVNEKVVRRYNCKYEPFGTGLEPSFNLNPEKKGSSGVINLSSKNIKELVKEQICFLHEKIISADLVLGAGLTLGVKTVADAKRASYRFVTFDTSELGATSNDPFIKRLRFFNKRIMVNLNLKSIINKERRKFGLKPINNVWKHWLGDNVIIVCDRVLDTVSGRVPFNFTQTGFMLLPPATGLPEKAHSFLNSGKPPVYIGFGRNRITDNEKYSQFFEQIRDKTGQRLIVSGGWADLKEKRARDICYVDEVPFELLFPRLAAAVYHGGTGTLASVARAGIPQAIFPFEGNQFRNQAKVVELGLGPATCDFNEMTSESISTAINECITNTDFKKNALEISKKLNSINGIEMTVELIEKTII
jgi:vancomycin aglycone glucosyltransferase